MPRINARPQDYTGKLAAEAKAKKTAEERARARALSMVDDEVDEELLETVDLTKGQTQTVRETVKNADDVEEVQEVEVAIPTKEFRVNTDLEMVTIGRDNHFDFEVGRTYRAPKNVYDHLEEKGYIYH